MPQAQEQPGSNIVKAGQSYGLLQALEVVLTRVVQDVGVHEVTGSGESPAFLAQKQFRAMDPPVFTGEGKAVVVDDWLHAVEWIFRTI